MKKILNFIVLCWLALVCWCLFFSHNTMVNVCVLSMSLLVLLCVCPYIINKVKLT